MKQTILLVLILFGGALNAGAQAAIQTITLKDGTVLKGTLSDVAESHYVISTSNLGEVRVPVEDVVSITTGQQPSLPASPTATIPLPSLGGQSPMGNFSQIQQAVLSDPKMMAEIQTLLSDEKIMNLLQDKSVMQDLMTMDPLIIQKNSAIQALMQDPKMQALMEMLSSQTGSSPMMQGNFNTEAPAPSLP